MNRIGLKVKVIGALYMRNVLPQIVVIVIRSIKNPAFIQLEPSF